MDQARQMQPLLELSGLKTWMHTSRGIVHAVDGVDLTVFPGESVGLVGESGCGKTMTARSILRLVPVPPGRIEGGQVRFNGRDLVAISDSEMDRLRGSEIAMVFQDPFTYLNPTMRIGTQIGEALRLHQPQANVDEEVAQILMKVGLLGGREFQRRYPHELSGGMRQRVLIAMALSCRPKLLLVDEPTTALDVTLQAQILALLRQLKEEMQLALLLISHDMGVVAELCDRVYVMYAGQIVESASVFDLFEHPQHPYTQGLLAGALSIEEFRPVLKTIPGTVPDLMDPAPGCRFRPRCEHAWEQCLQDPPMVPLVPGAAARCWLHVEAAAGGKR